jgi:hypothetical protein
MEAQLFYMCEGESCLTRLLQEIIQECYEGFRIGNQKYMCCELGYVAILSENAVVNET